MKNRIRQLLLPKLKNHFADYYIEDLNEHIINITVFHPFDMNIDDLNNIVGTQVSFICWIKGKTEGVVKTNKTYSFNFTGVQVIMKENEIVDLNLENLNIPFLNAAN